MREKYVFVDQNGKEYTEDSILDIYSNIVLTPRYINAGYFPIEDKFGDVASLKMVYIPESEDGGWYGDNLDEYNYYGCTVTNDNSMSADLDYKNGKLDQLNRVSTKNPVPANFTCEYFLTREFIGSLLASGVATYTSTSGAELNQSSVTITNPKTKSSTKFKFRGKYMFNSSSAEDGIFGWKSSNKETFWSGWNVNDGYVIANMLTCFYNALNPDKTQLSYVYLIKGSNNAVTDLTTTATEEQPVDKVLTIDETATGYRMVGNRLYNYLSHLITDDRQVPYVSTKPSNSYTNDLVLKKSAKFGKHGDNSDYTDRKYNYKNSYDGGLDNKQYYSSGAGLASYNYSGENAGTYNRSGTLRTGKEALGRISFGNDNINGLITGGYNLYSDPKFFGARNGCGIFYIQGLGYHDFEKAQYMGPYTLNYATAGWNKNGYAASAADIKEIAPDLFSGNLVSTFQGSGYNAQTGTIVTEAKANISGLTFGGISSLSTSTNNSDYTYYKKVTFLGTKKMTNNLPSTDYEFKTAYRNHTTVANYVYKEKKIRSSVNYNVLVKNSSGATSTQSKSTTFSGTKSKVYEDTKEPNKSMSDDAQKQLLARFYRTNIKR